MKTQKLSFNEIKSVMSRSEMKKIMAGSGGSCCYHNANWTDYSCAYNNSHDAQTAANISAQGTGQPYYWCCASC